MTRVVSLLKDDIYQLLEIKNDPYDRVVIHQGTLPEVEAKQAIKQLIDQARIEELEKLWNIQKVVIFDETLDEHIKKLKGGIKGGNK